MPDGDMMGGGGPGGPGGPGGGPAPGQPPMTPGAIQGGPAGPGSSPAMSPGPGAGAQAQADAMIKAVMPAFHKALSAFPIGSPKYKALLNAVKALADAFGAEEDGAMVPSAIAQLAQQARRGQPQRPGVPPGQAPPGGQPPMKMPQGAMQ